MSFRLRSFQWIGTGLMILFVSSAPGNDEPLQNPEEILPIPDLIGKLRGQMPNRSKTFKSIEMTGSFTSDYWGRLRKTMRRNSS